MHTGGRRRCDCEKTKNIGDQLAVAYSPKRRRGYRERIRLELTGTRLNYREHFLLAERRGSQFTILAAQTNDRGKV